MRLGEIGRERSKAHNVPPRCKESDEARYGGLVEGEVGEELGEFTREGSKGAKWKYEQECKGSPRVHLGTRGEEMKLRRGRVEEVQGRTTASRELQVGAGEEVAAPR